MLEILYQDEHYVAVDKPSGLMMHPSSLERHAPAYLLQELKEQLSQWVYLVHRLDRPTSGVVICALSKEAAAAASQIFADRRAHKTYSALVRGYLPHEGHIDIPLKNAERGVQSARTHWVCKTSVEVPAPVGRYPTARYSALTLTPETGRRHQLRRHCAHIGHPIVGDVSHGDRHHNHFFRQDLGVEGLFLHAQKLVFPHPFERRVIHMNAPLPARWSAASQALSWPELIGLN